MPNKLFLIVINTFNSTNRICVLYNFIGVYFYTKNVVSVLRKTSASSSVKVPRKIMNLIAWITICFSSISILSQSINDDIETAVVLIEQLRRDLRAAFDASGDNKPLLATTVRLIFHDCGGPLEIGDVSRLSSICNGCVTFSNIDNAGLQTGAVIPLELIYVSYQPFMSRADFWAAAGTSFSIHKIKHYI